MFHVVCGTSFRVRTCNLVTFSPLGVSSLSEKFEKCHEQDPVVTMTPGRFFWFENSPSAPWEKRHFEYIRASERNSVFSFYSLAEHWNPAQIRQTFRTNLLAERVDGVAITRKNRTDLYTYGVERRFFPDWAEWGSYTPAGSRPGVFCSPPPVARFYHHLGEVTTALPVAIRNGEDSPASSYDWLTVYPSPLWCLLNIPLLWNSGRTTNTTSQHVLKTRMEELFP